uniref:RNase H type-1 domain-containing protein n=1 Tax=Quercus lobata TaxID=97700 RepID=A0A7N2LAT9_QUELO
MVKKAKEQLQEFWDVQRSSTRPMVPREVVRSKSPFAGLFKINFDGAIFENMDLAGLGFVVRDEHGMIIASLSQRIPLPSSVDMVEALAARLAHSLARRAVLAADTNVWLEELPQDLDDVF